MPVIAVLCMACLHVFAVCASRYFVMLASNIMRVCGCMNRMAFFSIAFSDFRQVFNFFTSVLDFFIILPMCLAMIS